VGRNYGELINDILERMYSIENAIEGKTFEDFDKDEMLRDSILYKLIVIGEASNQLPDEIYERYQHIPWHDMRGLRNILTHEYFRTDARRIWEIITGDLPETRRQIEKLG